METVLDDASAAAARTTLGVTKANLGIDDNINVVDYGAVGDGTTDDTAAIQAAIDAAISDGHRSVFFPSGRIWKITTTLTITEGIVLAGEGPQGTSSDYGNIIRFVPVANNLPCLLFNGNGRSAGGTGGGIRNFAIEKGNTATGCEALKLLATDDDHRPGEMIIENVGIYHQGGQPTYLWSRAFHIDGSACVTSGSTGVRNIYLNKLRVASCTANNEYALINCAISLHGTLVLSQGNGSGTTGMTIKGYTTNLNLDLDVSGNVIIEGADTEIMNIRGRISVLDVNATALYGTANIWCGAITNVSPNFKIQSNITPSFKATVDTPLSNVTGNATDYTVIFETEKYDLSGSYAVATGIFTCPCAGVYLFAYSVGYTGIAAAHTRHDTALVHKNSAGTIQSQYVTTSAAYAMSISGALVIANTHLMRLAEGDTVEVLANASGGTKVVGLSASTSFAGYLLA
jgi:hypothetical protein